MTRALLFACAVLIGACDRASSGASVDAADLGRAGGDGVSTASPSVTILSDVFEIPQLGRTRPIRLYLPPDYETSGRRYPVLYMHDGQNLFDEATSYAGEWGIDETLDSLHRAGDPGIIVVGIDNGGTRRADEYSPAVEGRAYVRFIVETLKPYIDAHYNTLPERESTGIAGSSLGALISLHAALTRPDVFGLAGIFSPAIWFDREIFRLAAEFDAGAPRPRFYIVTGAREGDQPRNYIQGHERIIAALEGAGFQPGENVTGLLRADGTHSEWFWRREFPAAYQWLFPAAIEGMSLEDADTLARPSTTADGNAILGHR